MDIDVYTYQTHSNWVLDSCCEDVWGPTCHKCNYQAQLWSVMWLWHYLVTNFCIAHVGGSAKLVQVGPR
jgi:hypothetical protein